MPKEKMATFTNFLMAFACVAAAPPPDLSIPAIFDPKRQQITAHTQQMDAKMVPLMPLSGPLQPPSNGTTRHSTMAKPGSKKYTAAREKFLALSQSGVFFDLPPSTIVTHDTTSRMPIVTMSEAMQLMMKFRSK
jgi:hypothetical protein